MNNTAFQFIRPGAKVAHKDIKLRGTVLSCINLYDIQFDKNGTPFGDRVEQGPRYYVATSVDVWSIPQESLKVLEEGQGLSEYYKKRYAKYLISGFENSEFDAILNANQDPATLVTPHTEISDSAPSGAIK